MIILDSEWNEEYIDYNDKYSFSCLCTLIRIEGMIESFTLRTVFNCKSDILVLIKMYMVKLTKNHG